MSDENNKNLPVENKADTKIESKKKVKTIPAKKLPGLLKKKYSQKQLNKILKKISIPQDRILLEKYFLPDENKENCFSIINSENQNIIAPDFKRLKLIAKQIKSQKARVKFAPLIAIAGALVLLVIGVNLFKNVLLKHAIVTTMQSIFRAKCDVDSVNVKLLEPGFTITGIAQAKRSNPMKNYFEISKISVRLNMLHLLKGKFVVEDVSVLDITPNTDRKVSGKLSEEEEAKLIQNSAVVVAIKEKTEASLADCKRDLEGLFDQYNPERILENTKANLKSPELAKQAEQDIKLMIEKWQSKPKEIEDSVKDFSAKAEEIKKMDLDAIKKDPAKIAPAVKSIQAVIDEGKQLKASIEETSSSMKSDVNSVAELTKNLKSAIEADTAMTVNQLKNLASFNLDDGKDLLKHVIDNFGYQFFGKYYPYIEDIAAKASSSKSSGNSSPKADKKESKPKKQSHKRDGGRWVYYKNDNIPKFLLKNAQVSVHNSSADIDVHLWDISSDMDRYGFPAQANGTVSYGGLYHDGHLIVDLRSKENRITDGLKHDWIVNASYAGSGYTSSINLPEYVDSKAVPTFKGKVNLKSDKTGKNSTCINIYDDASFDANVYASFSDVQLAVESFEPVRVSNIYSNALGAIKDFDLGATIGYHSSGIVFDVNTNLDAKLKQGFYTALNQELESIKNQAIEKIKEELSARTSAALANVNGFDGIVERISNSENALDAIQAELENKINEIKNSASDAAKQKADEAKAKAEAEAKAKADEAKNKAKNELQNQLKGKIKF